MRKLIAISLFLTSLSVAAQTLDDIELFNTSDYVHGTPRFVSMGGAFTALGNDFSAIHLNPAGANIYRNPSFGFSLGVQALNNNSTFLNTSKTNNKTNVLIDNIGYVYPFKAGAYNDEHKMAFSLSYNKIAQFNRKYSHNGTNALGSWGIGSYADYVLNNPNGPLGLSSDVLTAEEYALYDAGILVEENGLITDIAFGNSGTGISNLNYTREESGNLSEFLMGLSAATKDEKLHAGLALGFPSLNYTLTDNIEEKGLPTDTFPFDANAYNITRVNEINANGINVKLGLIYKPAYWVRIGASYQSPSWYTVEQIQKYTAGAYFDNGDVTESDEIATANYSYKLRTPSIYRAGLAFILKKSAVISIDYEYNKPASTKAYFGNNSSGIPQDDLDNASQDVNNFMTTQQRIKIGGEYRFLDYFAWRAGYSYHSSIYKDDQNYLTAANVYSLGLGFQNSDFGIDIAYAASQSTRNDFVGNFYDANGTVIYPQLAESKMLKSNIVASFTVRF